MSTPPGMLTRNPAPCRRSYAVWRSRPRTRGTATMTAAGGRAEAPVARNPSAPRNTTQRQRATTCSFTRKQDTPHPAQTRQVGSAESRREPRRHSARGAPPRLTTRRHRLPGTRSLSRSTRRSRCECFGDQALMSDHGLVRDRCSRIAITPSIDIGLAVGIALHRHSAVSGAKADPPASGDLRDSRRQRGQTGIRARAGI